MTWPRHLPAVQVRIARPTNQLEELVRFYRDGVGLPDLGGFEDHDGYSGAMFGLPDRGHHLELTSRGDGRPCPAPTPDHLLVLYIPDREAVEACVSRLAAMGYHAVPPLNPYWAQRGVTIPDPDGWRLVLMESSGQADHHE